MEKKTYYVHSSELSHHGIKNMRWGVRRYQNPDGSLTPAGRKRYAKKASKEAAAAAKKKAAEEAAEAERKKDPKNMSDDDMRKAIARKKLENEYRQYYPEKVSKGKQFMTKFIDEALTPSLISAGKSFLNNAFEQYGKDLIEKYMPKEEPSEMSKLQKKSEKAKLEKTIAEAEKARIDAENARMNLESRKKNQEKRNKKDEKEDDD